MDSYHRRARYIRGHWQVRFGRVWLAVCQRECPSPSRWLQVPVSWQGRGGPQCPGGTWIHAGPRVPSQLMALEIGASAALEQPEKPRQARGPGSVTPEDTQAGAHTASNTRPNRTCH